MTIDNKIENAEKYKELLQQELKLKRLKKYKQIYENNIKT